MKKVEVVAAIILNNSQVLSVQRPSHKLDYISQKFEFPGGKIENGESKEVALKRELAEELALKANIGKHVITVNHQYPDFQLTMHAYIVRVANRELTLNEHISSIWLCKNELSTVDWAAADIPIVDELKSKNWEKIF